MPCFLLKRQHKYIRTRRRERLHILQPALHQQGIVHCEVLWKMQYSFSCCIYRGGNVDRSKIPVLCADKHKGGVFFSWKLQFYQHGIENALNRRTIRVLIMHYPIIFRCIVFVCSYKYCRFFVNFFPLPKLLFKYLYISMS